MSFWQQIVAFAFKGLKPSYYWRHFVLGAIVPVIIIGLQIYVGFSNPEISTGTAVIGILSYIAGALFLLILYPFSRFAYESIVEFVMGNNVIISNALLFLTYKYISYAILLCFSFCHCAYWHDHFIFLQQAPVQASSRAGCSSYRTKSIVRLL